MTTITTEPKSAPRKRLPRLRRALSREALFSSLIVFLGVAAVTLSGDLYWRQLLLIACLYLIAANGLNLLRAQAEQMSFGQGAVMGVAAYVTALATSVWNLPGAVAVLLGLLGGMLAGLLMALPALRVQGYYLGFVTMAAALALPHIYFLLKDQTKAVTGVNVPPSWIHDAVFGNVTWLTLGVVLCAIGSIYLVALVRSSRFGRRLKIAGVSPEAAATLGLRPGTLRLEAFAVSSLCASVAGVLYIGLIQYIAPGSFTLTLSILLFFIVIIGGPGTIAGPLAGVVLLYLVPDGLLSSLLDYRLLVYGLIAFIVMFFIPDGIVGGVRRLIRRMRPHVANSGVISLEPVIEGMPRVEVSASERPDRLLRVEGVTKSFGKVQALSGATLEIGTGTLHAIVGPNGSGKTTLLNAISGLIRPDSGTIEFAGRDVTRESATNRARAGLARTFQTPRVIPEFSVWENIDCGRTPEAHAPIADSLREVRAQWDTISASTLPHGQRRFLEVLRVLNQSPKLLALDEPAAGLSRSERQEFVRLLRIVIESTGATVLMVEHDLDLVWSAADVISVVDGGRVIAHGTPSELRHSPEIAHLFTGVTHVEG